MLLPGIEFEFISVRNRNFYGNFFGFIRTITPFYLKRHKHILLKFTERVFTEFQRK